MTISGGLTPIRGGADIPAASPSRAPFAPSTVPYTAFSATSYELLSSSSIYTFAIQPSMAWQKGARARALSNPSNSWIEGVVVSYVGTELTIRSDRSFITAAGPYVGWTITIAGEAEVEHQLVCSGEILDATLVETHSLGAATFTLKTLFSGLDPSPENPVIFQAPSGATRIIDAPLSLTIPASATLNVSASRPFRLWFVLIDEVGFDVHLGVGQSRDFVNNIAGFQGRALMSTESPPGSFSGVFYSDKTMENVSYIVLGFADYDNGLATSGIWNVSPSRFVLYANGSPLPGDTIQVSFTRTGITNSTGLVVPINNTIPQFPGEELFGVNVTPLSRSSVFVIDSQAVLATDTGVAFTACLFENSNANALASCWQSGGRCAVQLRAQKFLGNTTPTRFRLMAGRETATGTVLTLNGTSVTTGYYQNTFNSFIRVVERMT